MEFTNLWEKKKKKVRKKLLKYWGYENLKPKQSGRYHRNTG